MCHEGHGLSDEPCYSAVHFRGIYGMFFDQIRMNLLVVPIHCALVHSTK